MLRSSSNQISEVGWFLDLLGQRTNSARQAEHGYTHMVRVAVPCQDGTVTASQKQKANQHSSSEVPESAGDKGEKH